MDQENSTNIVLRIIGRHWRIMAISLVFILGVLAFNIFFVLQHKIGWKDIIPGITSREDLIKKLGAPRKEIDLGWAKGVAYASGIDLLPNTVLFDATSKVVSDIFVTASSENEGRRYYVEMTLLGAPDRVMYSRMFRTSKIFIFASRGVAFSADGSTKLVDGVHYYRQTTTEDYLKKYGQFFDEKNARQF